MPLSSIKATGKVIIPRNFVLLAELESVEKISGYTNGVSYGLESYDDNLLLDKWEGFIMSDRNIDLIHFIKIHAGPNYPIQPPGITFTAKPPPSLAFIDKDGHVTSGFPLFRNWNDDLRIKDALLSLKQYLP